MSIQERMQALLDEAGRITSLGDVSGEDAVALGLAAPKSVGTVKSPYSNEKFDPNVAELMGLLEKLGKPAMTSAAKAYLKTLKERSKDKQASGYHGPSWMQQELSLMSDLVDLLDKHKSNIVLHP